jgi:hypothetical protein
MRNTMLRTALLVGTLLAQVGWPATIRVPDQYASIQAAIDVAVEADTILVAPGEYMITEPLTLRGKGITLRGETGPDATTIRMTDAPADPMSASVVLLVNGETRATVLEDLTITGGQARHGGGVFIHNARPVIRNCWIVGNRTMDGYSEQDVTDSLNGGNGGGVYSWPTAYPLLIGCRITSNTTGDGYAHDNVYACGSGGDGAGVYCSYAEIEECTISENSSGNGAQFALASRCSSPTMPRSYVRLARSSPRSPKIGRPDEGICRRRTTCDPPRQHTRAFTERPLRNRHPPEGTISRGCSFQ